MIFTAISFPLTLLRSHKVNPRLVNELRSKDAFLRRSSARSSSAIFVHCHYIRFHLKGYCLPFFLGFDRCLSPLLFTDIVGIVNTQSVPEHSPQYLDYANTKSTARHMRQTSSKHPRCVPSEVSPVSELFLALALAARSLAYRVNCCTLFVTEKQFGCLPCLWMFVARVAYVFREAEVCRMFKKERAAFNSEVG